MSNLTQGELKRLFYYDPETGDFIRRVRTANRTNIGDVAGSNSHGYKRIKINNKGYAAHRLVFLYVEGKFPENGFQVDHIDQNPSNNTWSNLRIVTHQENARNHPLRKDNTSKCVGVTWYKRFNKWTAAIMINGKRKHLGYFQNKCDAIAAREAANKQFGYHKNHGKQKEGAA